MLRKSYISLMLGIMAAMALGCAEKKPTGKGGEGVIHYQGIAGDPTLIAERDPILSGVDLTKFGVTFNDEEDWQPTSSLSRVGAVPNPFTPNGDGVNDKVMISLVVVKITEPISVKVFINRDPQTIVRTMNFVVISGVYQIQWDGKDENGLLVAPGIYRIFLQIGEEKTYGDVWVITEALLEGG